MLKAVGQGKDGRTFILLGLEEENIRLLKEGKPLLIQGTQIGLDVDIAISYGETVEALMNDWRSAGLIP